jgi:uncharacterized protein
MAGAACMAAGTTFPVQASTGRKRTLGRTGLEVSEIGFGAERVSDVTVIRMALDLGVNFFDTARDYSGGTNEGVLRDGLGPRRKNVIVSSRSYGKDAKAIRRDLDTSLRELRTDYLDIWYIGSKDSPDSVSDEMLDVQRSAKAEGKIRFSGLSTHRLHQVMPFVLGRGGFDVIQIPYNFAIGAREDPFDFEATNLSNCLDDLSDAGVGVVAMKVMAGGYRDKESARLLNRILRREGAYAAALRWALMDSRIQTTSIRMADREQLEENVWAATTGFTQEDGETLRVHLRDIRPLLCRMCGDCDGVCPQGLPVSDLVRYATYADGYRDRSKGLAAYRGLQPAIREVRCEDCAECVVRCPNGVNVRKQVGRAQRLFA